MSASNAPFGFRLARQPSVHGAARPFPIASGLAVNLFSGDAVKLSGTAAGEGTIDLATADGTRNSSVAGIPVLGIFVGCEYTDSTGKPVKTNMWPASTVATNAIAWVVEGDQNEFVVQADGAIAKADIGTQCDLTDIFDGVIVGGSTMTGLSVMTVSATPIADDAQGAFQVIDFVEDGLNTAGDAYTQVIVRIANPQLGRAGRTVQNAAGT
jgi:hypothetical protein